MVYLDRIDISEGIDVYKTRQSEKCLKLVLKYVFKTCFEHIYFVLKK